jgi:SpoIIAA-like
MLEKISDLPDPVLGFRASGELTSDDYRNVLVPAVEAALRSRDKLRLLYVLGDDVTGFSAGAAWQDTKVGMEHVTRWERIAVVTDREWLRQSVSIFGHLIPGEIKAFPAAQEQDARAWIAR